MSHLGFRLEQLEVKIKDFLVKANLTHCDETSLSVNGTKHWLHTVGTEKIAHFALHPKRGQSATVDIGILPGFKGILIHDHWKSYFGYKESSHALCNAHHLKELRFIHEQHLMKWADKMSQLLINIKVRKDTYIKQGKNKFSSWILKRYNSTYDEILIKAKKEQARRGNLDSHNLIKRLSNYKQSVLLFMNDFDVPFTNNLSEQDLRMSKIKQKISGCFRNITSGTHFCKIRSLLVSGRKNNKNPFLIIQEAFQNKISLQEIIAT